MKQMSNSLDLLVEINRLKSRKKEEEVSLNEQLKKTYESFKPVSIFKESLSEIVSSSEIKKDLTTITIGLLTGYLAKKIVIGKTTNPISGWIGNVFEMIVTSKTINHIDEVKSMSNNFINKVLN
jgi:uncharacterized membrane protein YeaQ/YmgE (transglycosylase-associated protein family)